MIADFDFDQDADADDLFLMIDEYGRTDCSLDSPCACDMDNNGRVDNVDLSFMAEDMGQDML